MKTQRSFSPNFLSKLSKDYGFESKVFERNNNIPTYILFKGSPTEFNSVRVFDDIKRDSSLSRKWKKALSELPIEQKQVDVYSYEKFEIVKKPIEEIIEVFSMDDEKGNEIARFVNFTTDITNFESNEDDKIIVLLFLNVSTQLDLSFQRWIIFISLHTAWV